MTNQPPNGGPVAVRVWGDFACFTRPEFGVERVSYPTMTPTAAVGVLDAIFWKPEFRWRIVAIDILRPVRWVQVRRNEVLSCQTLRIAKRWATGDDKGTMLPLIARSGLRFSSPRLLTSFMPTPTCVPASTSIP